MFLIRCIVNAWVCFHCNKQYKRQRKVKITPYWENVYLLTYRDIIWNLVGYVCEKFFTIKNGMHFRFYENNGNIKCLLIRDQM